MHSNPRSSVCLYTTGLETGCPLEIYRYQFVLIAAYKGQLKICVWLFCSADARWMRVVCKPLRSRYFVDLHSSFCSDVLSRLPPGFQDMMHGTLEVKQDALTADAVKKPEWMDEVAAEDMTEEQKKVGKQTFTYVERPKHSRWNSWLYVKNARNLLRVDASLFSIVSDVWKHLQ